MEKQINIMADNKRIISGKFKAVDENDIREALLAMATSGMIDIVAAVADRKYACDRIAEYFTAANIIRKNLGLPLYVFAE